MEDVLIEVEKANSVRAVRIAAFFDGPADRAAQDIIRRDVSQPKDSPVGELITVGQKLVAPAGGATLLFTCRLHHNVLSVHPSMIEHHMRFSDPNLHRYVLLNGTYPPGARHG